MSELWRLGAAALADGYRSGAFDPTQALDACLARAQACQGSINAFVHIDADGARTAARKSAGRWARGAPIGPLDGVPVSLKDNLLAAGMPTTWGSRLLRDYTATHDELPVARLRASGAVIFGKTNLPEFALQGTTENQLHGITRNPWDLSLTPGGSSGGAAAAVASGCGPLALVTDGGGSTRRPASHTGLVGFKPSSGLIARGGGLPEIFLDHEVPGIIGRRVSDVHALATALSANGVAAPADRPARILFIAQFAQHPVDPGIAQRVSEVARQLEALGHRVEAGGSASWAEEVNQAWPLLSGSGLAWMLKGGPRFPQLGTAESPDLSLCGPSARANVAQAEAAGAPSLFAALAAIHDLREQLDGVFAHCDFILTPATAALPWPVEQTHPVQIGGMPAGPRGHAVFTAFANAAGLPAIALPCGFVNGLPTGFQLVARAGDDAALLSLALQFERAFSWHDHWPPEPVATMGAQ